MHQLLLLPEGGGGGGRGEERRGQDQDRRIHTTCTEVGPYVMHNIHCCFVVEERN